MENIEIEFKNSLTREQFEHLCTIFPLKQIIQKSTYLDTSDICLLRKRIALRIRETNQGIKLTIKHEFDNYIKEVTDEISSEEVQMIIETGKIKSKIINEYLYEQGIKDKFYKVTATFVTDRRFCDLEEGKLFLDKTIFENDSTDYELEVEYDNYEQGKVKFHKLLTKYDLERQKTEHKISRAVRNRKED